MKKSVLINIFVLLFSAFSYACTHDIHFTSCLPIPDNYIKIDPGDEISLSCYSRCDVDFYNINREWVTPSGASGVTAILRDAYNKSRYTCTFDDPGCYEITLKAWCSGDSDSMSWYVLVGDIAKGPYLIYENDNDSMTVMWQLAHDLPCTLEWDDEETFTNASSVDNTVTEITDSSSSEYLHKYVITGLNPGTQYYYRVTLTGSGEVFPGSFRTAPADDATQLKFMVTGDCQDNHPDQDAVFSQMKSVYETDSEYQTFLLQCGDKVDSDLEGNWGCFFSRYDINTQNFLANVAFQSCIGNHETWGPLPKYQYCDKYWQYPNYATNKHYWSFDYGPAHIIVADQYALSTVMGGDQLTWIANDLAATDKVWKFIILHEPGYSGRGEGHTEDSEVKNSLQPLCVQYGVDIVFAGHQHYYASCEVEGIKHITNVGGAGTLREPDDADNISYCDVTDETHCFNTIDINGGTLEFRAYDISGNQIDSFTLIKSSVSAPVVENRNVDIDDNGHVILSGEILDTGGSAALSARIYYGTSDGGQDSGEWQMAWPSSGFMTSAQGDFTSDDLTDLNPGTLYYYRCYAENPQSPSLYDWENTETHNNPNPINFITASEQTKNPYPPDDSTGVASSVVLRWEQGDSDIEPSYDVYFGDEASVNSATCTTPDVFRGNYSDTIYPVFDALSDGVEYFWRVDEVVYDEFNDVNRIRRGSTWSFTTRNIYTLLAESSVGGVCLKSPDRSTYYENSYIQLSPVPDVGYEFDHWTGDIGSDPTDSELYVAMTMNKSITAHFVRTKKLLTIDANPPVGGGISPSIGIHAINPNSTVTVHAIAAEGYEFVSWTSTATLPDPSKQTVTFAMDDDHSLTANFIAVDPVYTLNISSDSSGTTNPAPGLHSDLSGQVEVSAISPDNFIRWEGSAVAAGKIPAEDKDDPTVSFNIDGDYTLHAVFDYKLEISRNCDGGIITKPGLGVYRKTKTPTPGTVALEAVPNDGYRFDGWAGSTDVLNAIADPSSASTSIEMNNDYVVLANFMLEQYDLEIDAHPNGTLVSHTAGTAYTHDYFTKIPVEAKADPGYHFAGWTGTAVDAGQVTNPSSPRTTILMEGELLVVNDHYTLTATFEADQYRIDIPSTRGGYASVDGASLQSGGVCGFEGISTASIQAYVEPGYQFMGWSGTSVAENKLLDPDSGSTSLTVDGNYTLRPVFELIKPTVIYVSLNGDNSDGASWQTAFHHLQDALNFARAGNPVDQIWVTAETYYPDEVFVGTAADARLESFELIEGVEVYGGFLGDEESLEQRNAEINVTTLSGSINNPEDDADNSFHVVTGADDAVLDGFTITKGNANGTAYPNNCGGGLHCDEVSPTIQNCIIIKNAAVYSGGMYNYKNQAQVINCKFSHNTAQETGGAVHNSKCIDMEFKDCRFIGNIDYGQPCIDSFDINDSQPTWVWEADPAGAVPLKYGTETAGQYIVINPDFVNISDDDDAFGNNKEYQIRWGNTGNPSEKSGLGFTSNIFVDSVPVNTEFMLGQLRHFNYPISNPVKGTDIKVNLNFTDSAIESPEFEFYLAVNETANDCDDSPDCSDDHITFPLMFPSQLIMINRREYTLKIIEFRDEYGNKKEQFDSPEGSVNKAYLWAKITPPPIDASIKNIACERIAIENCLFVGNHSNAWGGAISNWDCDEIIVRDSTIIGNHGYLCGGIYSFESGVDIVNSILWDNINIGEDEQCLATTITDQQIYNVSADCEEPGGCNDRCSVTYSCIQDDIVDEVHFEGTGNIDDAPLFVRNPYDGGDGWGIGSDDFGDLRLTTGSLCIDKGDNESVPADITEDLDGKPRFVNDPTSGTEMVVDMGAYEYQAGNTRPVAVDDTFDFIDTNPVSSQTVFISADDLLQNDEDVDDNTLVLDSVYNPSSGTLEEISGGYNYTPDFTGAGSATFTYTVFDGIAVSDEATVTINIKEPEDLSVDAGGSRTVTLNENGIAQISLHDAVISGGGVVNPGAANVTKTWTPSYAPPTGSVDWNAQESELHPTVTLTLGDPDIFAYMGSVQFELQLDGTLGLRSAQDTVVITVLPGPGFQAAPQVDAGVYDPLRWPTENTVRLNGTVTDDGLPYGVLECRWTVVEGGEDNVHFEDEFAEDTNITFTAQGRYRLRLEATDLEKTGFGETIILVGDAATNDNQPPTVTIIENDAIDTDGIISVTLMDGPAWHDFEVAVTDDNLPDSPGELTYVWSVVPIDGTPVDGVIFNSIYRESPQATFSKSGIYEVQVEVSDGQYSAFDSISVEVADAGSGETLEVDAGPDQEIRLPAIAHLVGKATLTDSQGNTLFLHEEDLNARWSLLDGPARVSFVDDSNGRQLYAKAEFTEPGTYIFRLEGNYHLSESVDEVLVIVNRQVKIVEASRAGSFIVDSTKNSGLWSFGKILNYIGADLGQALEADDYWSLEEYGWGHLGIPYFIPFKFTFPTPVYCYSDYENPQQQGQLKNIMMLDSSKYWLHQGTVALDKDGYVWGWGEIYRRLVAGDGNGSVYGGLYFYLDPEHDYFDNLVMKFPPLAGYDPSDEPSDDWGIKWELPMPLLCGDQDTESGYLEDIAWISYNYGRIIAIDSHGHAWTTLTEDRVLRKVFDKNNEKLKPIPSISQSASPSGADILLEKLDEEQEYYGKIYSYSVARLHYSWLPILGRDAIDIGTPNYVEWPDINNDGIHDEIDKSEYAEQLLSDVPEEHLRNIVKIDAGEYNAFALEEIDPENSDVCGRVFNWGHFRNRLRLFGNILYDNTAENVYYPILVEAGEQSASEFLQYIVDISVGEEHCIAVEDIDPDNGRCGHVYTWGMNEYGQLGTGDDCVYQITPVKVVAPDLDGDGYSDVTKYGSDFLQNIIEVDAGNFHCLALDKDGNIYAWGEGDHCQLGTGSEDTANSIPRLVQFEKKVHNLNSGLWYYEIQEAINEAVDEDHIVVHPGVYYEDVNLLDKNIILSSEDPADLDVIHRTVITGCITIDTDSTDSPTSVISGFTVRGGISVNGTGGAINDKIFISSNIITDASGTGIEINTASAVHILNNQIVNCFTGINLISSNAFIGNNTIVDNMNKGVNASPSSNPKLVNNIVLNNGSSASDNINGILESACYFCCIGGNSGTPETPDTNGNFSVAGDLIFESDTYSLCSDSPCINAGFMGESFTSASSFTTAYTGCYQSGDLILIGNNRIPRVVDSVDAGAVQFSPALGDIPASETGIIHCNQLCQLNDKTSGAGSTNMFIVADASLYRIGDIVQIDGSDFVSVVYVHPEGQVTFAPDSESTTAGVDLTVWKLSDIQGNPRVIDGRVDIGADELCPWHVNAGDDQSLTVLEHCETTGASVEYAGFSDPPNGNIEVQWSMVDSDAVSESVTFGESGKLNINNPYTSVNFNNKVGTYTLQLAAIEDGWPVAWDTMNVDVLYDISYTDDSILDIKLPDEAHIELDVQGTGPDYDVQWYPPVTEWYGRSVQFSDDSLETVNVILESAGYYPLTVELADKYTGKIVGKQTIGVTGQLQFTNVILESDADEITWPDNRISFVGRVEGIQGNYMPEWQVVCRDSGEIVPIADFSEWAMDVCFNEPGMYDIYLIVKEFQIESELQFPTGTIIGSALKTIEVKHSIVDAGVDQIVMWPQNYAHLFGRVQGGDSYSWSGSGVSFDYIPSVDAILNPKATFSETGLYTLSLSAFNGGDDLGTDEVNIFVIDPDVEVEAGQDISCHIGDWVTLYDGTSTAVPSGSNVVWFAPSSASEIASPYSLESAETRFTEAGEYQVYLIAENDQGQHGMDSMSVTVTSKSGITITSDPAGPIDFIDRESVTFAASLDSVVYPPAGELPEGVTAQWIADETVTFESIEALTTNASFSSPGYHQVRIELYRENTCIDYAATTVLIDPPSIGIDAKVEGLDEYFDTYSGASMSLDVEGKQLGQSAGVTYTYSWDFATVGDGIVTGLPAPSNQLLPFTAVFFEPGIYKLTLTASDEESSVTVALDTVTVALQSSDGQPIVSAGRNYPVAVEGVGFPLYKTRIWDDLTIVQDATHLQWTSTPSASFSSENEVVPFVTFASEGRYDLLLTYTDDGGKSDSDTVTIYVQPNYSVFAGFSEMTYPYTDFEMDDAKVTPHSSRYSYEWTYSPSNAEIEFNPDRFCLNPTVRFDEIGDYALTLNVSKGDMYIGSDLATIQVRSNPQADNTNPEITEFTATYAGGSVEGKSDVRGDIEISVEAEDDNLDRIELIIGDGITERMIDGDTMTVTAGTYEHPAGLKRLKRLDSYFSGAVTLTARAIDRFGNISEKTKTFTSIHNIVSFEVQPDIIDKVGDPLTFSGVLNTETGDWTNWTLSITETVYTNTGAENTFTISDNLVSGNSFSIQIPGTGKYSAMLTAGGDTAKVTFDVVTAEGGISENLVAEIDPGLDVEFNDTQTPASAIAAITEGLYDLQGKACHQTFNNHVRYKLMLRNDSGFSKNVTPGLLDGKGYTKNWVGTSSSQGSLGELDFTNIPNGIYTLSLAVECMGTIATDSVDVNISTPLKVGHVKFSQEDMSINIGGYPLSVIRSYDGLSRHRKGDFGYGWVYSLANMEIDLYEDRVQGDDHTYRVGDIYSRNVTLTLPTGQKATFTSQFSGPGVLHYTFPANMGISYFNAKGGEHWIKSAGISQAYNYWEGTNPSTNLYCDHMYEALQRYDIPGYELKMQDGTVYHIARESYDRQYVGAPVLTEWHEDEAVIYEFKPYGKPYLSQIVLPTGEKIVFNVNTDDPEKPETMGVQIVPKGRETGDDAIKMYYDLQGRIIAIYGPGQADTIPSSVSDSLEYRDHDDARPTVMYFYGDNYDNLTEVRRLIDPEGDTESDRYEITTYEYENTQYNPADHYVTAIRDARGIAPIRYEYDGQGRLIATIDAKGNRIAISHDVIGDQKMETVTDRSGNITDYIYNNRGNVICTNKYDSQGNFLTQTRYQYDDAGNPDSPTEVGRLVDFDNVAEPGYPGDYHVTRTIYYADSNGKVKYNIDALWNITAYVYDGENLTHTTQLAWESAGVPGFSEWDYGGLVSLLLADLTETYNYTALSTTENTYTDNGLLKTTEVRGNQTWYSMSVTLYDDQNRVTDTIQIDTDVINSSIDPTPADLATQLKSILSLSDLALLPDADKHIITSYQYDEEVYPVGHPKAGLPISNSSHQPYSVSDPYTLDQTAEYRQFSYYDTSNRQMASWYFKDGMRILSLSDLDAQGRNKRSIQVIEETTDIPEFDTIFSDINEYIGTREAIVQSETEYNRIGKVWTSQGQHLPGEKGSLTVYTYDEIGQLVETRTYASADDYDPGNPNSDVLTISRTLYDAEGRTLVSVGPYAAGDTPVSTETVYDGQGRVVETRQWANVDIPYVTLYGKDGSAVGLKLPVNTQPANAWDGVNNRSEDIGWTANGGRLPVVGQEISYSRTVYDNAGRVQMSVAVDESGYEQPTSYEYDDAGRQIAVIDPLGHNCIWENGKLTSVNSDPLLGLGHRSETQYEGTRRKYAFDAGAYYVDDPSSPTAYGYSYWTEYIYDAIGRVTTTIHPPTDYVDEEGVSKTGMPTYTHTAYDGLGRKLWDMAQVSYSDDDLQAMLTAGTYDAFIANHAKQYTYDTSGRLMTVTLPDPDGDGPLVQPVYQYYYDDFGNQVCILDPLGRATIFEYDHLNRLTAKYMPFDTELTSVPRPAIGTILSLKSTANPLSETKEYDSEGRLLIETDYKGQTVIYYYYDNTNDSTGSFKGLPGQLQFKDFFTAHPCSNPTDPLPDPEITHADRKERYGFTYDKYGRKVTETVTDYAGGSAVITYQAVTGYDTQGRVDSIITQQAGPDGVPGDYKMINYDYHPITGQKIKTSVLSSPADDGEDFTLTDKTDYSYDLMGRLDTVGNGETLATYGYTAVGSRDYIQIDTDSAAAGWEIKTDYTYNALNRLTNLVNQNTAESISGFNYTLKADGMRTALQETILQTTGTSETRNIDYQYDNLNRLDTEAAVAQTPATGDYDADYTYDLAGNRTDRVVHVGAQTLTTQYDYYPGTDKLMTEVHCGPACAMRIGQETYYAYANPSGGVYYQSSTDSHIGPYEAFWLGLPNAMNATLFYTLMILIPVVFLWPVLVRQWSRMNGRIDPLNSSNLGLWHRMMCVLLAYIFLIGPEAFHMLARAEVQYANLNTATWGADGDFFTYSYDANGSQVYKVHAEISGIETMTPADIDSWLSTNTTVAYEYHTYNLQNRLARIDKYIGYQSLLESTEYRYNTAGIRIAKIYTPDGATPETTTYLIDPANHTGYAQVIEEITDDGTDLDRIQYVIGDDVLAQTRSEWNDGDTEWGSFSRQYLLYDGHGSTRQLANASGLPQDSYSYDACGVMLTGAGQSGADAASNAATNLLYTGEQYDADAQQYYLRARYYNPANGLFNRLDPYPGNTHDPQSLHKYTYCHNNPVNNIDPTGMFISGLVGLMTVMTITTSIFSMMLPVAGGVYAAVKAGISPGEYLNELFSSATWKEALIAVGMGAVIGMIVKQIAKKIASSILVVLGLMLSIWGAIQSIGLTKSMVQGNMSGRDIAHFLAFSTAVIILGVLIGSIIKKGSSKPGVNNAPEEPGIYEFKSDEGTVYVGQSKHLHTRINQHLQSGKLKPQDLKTLKWTKLPGSSKTDREIAEQLRIRGLGGIEKLANKMNPIGPNRQHLLP